MHKIGLKFGAKTIDIIYNLARDLKDADSRPTRLCCLVFTRHGSSNVKLRMCVFFVSFTLYLRNS
jgi:hypothetical protein